MILKVTTTFGWEYLNYNPYLWSQPDDLNYKILNGEKYILPRIGTSIVNVKYTPRPLNVFHTKEFHQNYVYPGVLPSHEISYIEGMRVSKIYSFIVKFVLILPGV